MFGSRKLHKLHKMEKVIGYIIAGIGGLLLGEAIRDEPKKKTMKETLMDTNYWIYFRSSTQQDNPHGAYFDKVYMEFYDYPTTKKWFEKMVREKRIFVKNILDYSSFERETKQRIIEQDPKDWEHKNNDYVKIASISWGIGDQTFEEIEAL